MPRPEMRRGDPRREEEIVPYQETRRYRDEPSSRQAYFALQEAIFTNRDNDLSTFRFSLNERWCVSVLGERPADELRQQIEEILAPGEPASLPRDVLEHLADRRSRANKQGSWVERHFR